MRCPSIAAPFVFTAQCAPGVCRASKARSMSHLMRSSRDHLIEVNSDDIGEVNELKYTWNGHEISYLVSGSVEAEPVLLVHGFGASKGHFRKLIPDLSKKYRVYAIDLIGFGKSDKPLKSYSLEVFKSQIEDFISDFVVKDGSPGVHIVGNSIGSLASLIAAQGNDSVQSLVLCNCAGGLNNKALQDDWRIKLAMPIFLLIDALLMNEKIGRYLFDQIRQKESLRNILQGVYPKNPSAVDEELIEMLHQPSNDENALHVFVNIITTNNAGPSPLEVMDNVNCPLLFLWGTRDNLTPSDGPIGKFFQGLKENGRKDTEFVHLDGVGHCPMDEVPDEILTHLLPWLSKYAV
jgi:pimeloyl-ACP methyl ester carboxylesterase